MSANKSQGAKLIELIETGLYSLAFHGSPEEISKFRSDKIGRGSDANSSWGLFLTELPQSAIEYSSMLGDDSDSGFIYVVLHPAERYFEMWSGDTFFMHDAENPLEAITEIKAGLIEEGYAGITHETGEDVIRVVFDPGKAEIIAKMSADELELLDYELFNPRSLAGVLIDAGIAIKNVRSKYFRPCNELNPLS